MHDLFFVSVSVKSMCLWSLKELTFQVNGLPENNLITCGCAIWMLNITYFITHPDDIVVSMLSSTYFIACTWSG